MRIPEGRRTLLGINMGGVATWIFLFCATTLFTQYAGASEPRVVCYYTNWSVYRPGTARFNPQNINPYLCTHLIYAFGGFTKDNTLKPFDKYQDIEKGGYAKFTGLKTYNSRLKTMLAIGGWNEGSSRFSPMVASRERRKEFVRNAIKFLRQNRFDGLDLDWEYPAFRDGGKPKDRDNYARLVRELREEFERESQKSGKPRLLLTMAVPAGIEYIQKGFDVTALNRYLDWMNLLSYDYHSAFEPAVNHHAPLYPLEEPSEYSVDTELNIDYTIQYYLENGADRDKLVLGIPTYGRSYTLFNPDATELGAPADGPGEQGDATREKGYLAYYEICESLKDKPKKKRSIDSDDEGSDDEEAEEEEEEDLPWTVVHHNPQAMGPVAFRGNQWVGYDDIDIVKKKAEYVADKGLGGIMFWSIDNDDFRGNCHGKPYPLIEAAKEAYITKLGITDNAITNERQSSGSSRRRSRPKSSSSTAAPTTRAAAARRKPGQDTKSTTPVWSYNTPEPPTTPDPGSDFKCTDEGFFPHPRDCKKYFWCLDSGPSNLGIVAHAFTCPSGLFFNKAADSCDFARNVLCKMPSVTTTSKPKTSTTSQPRTTTARPTERAVSATTTTRRPNKLTSKSSVYFRTTTTTTPRSLLDEDEVYEDEIIEDAEAADVESEDPRVIKELIDLIKKAGGVEQLERHLKLSESSGSPGGGAGAGTTTPLPISKKLYQRVLEQTRQGGKSNLLDRYNSLSRDDVSGGAAGGGHNSRPAPQNAGLESAPEASSLRKERPQYTTINRSRPTITTTEESDLESREDAAEALVEEEEPRQSLLRTRTSESGQSARPLPQYVNIRRARPSTQPPADAGDDSASRNALFERNEATILSTVTEYPPPASPAPGAGRRDTPEYVTIRRTRPTTTTTSAAAPDTATARYQTTEQERPVYEETDDEASPPPVPAPAALQYSTLQRTRAPPTPSPAAEPLTSPEPTTVLAVQISSLLNSPVTSQPERTNTEAALSAPEPTLPATAEPEPPTTVTDPPTTTTTTASAPVSASTRRSILKRVRSTTTSTAAPTTAATQVSSERSYNIIRRRRPNEISSDSDPAGTPRKVRSTTPDSREAAGNVQPIGETGVVSRGSRYRRIRPSTDSDDSVASAAAPAPVSRGRFRPALSRDELLSLTPIDDETPQTVPLERIAPRPERRFRPRNRPVTPSDAAPDAEASAATVEVQRPEFIPRGRSRFTASTTTEKTVSSTDIPSVEAAREERRPIFSRFTPRPFSRLGTTAPADQEALVSDNIPNESESEIAATPRSPVRLPFGRTRSPLFAPRTVVPQARIVSPLLRSPSTGTDESIKESVPEDEIEEKTDDIHLSESTIEEKEHEDSKTEDPQDKPRSPAVLNVLFDNFSLKDDEQSSKDTSSTSENDINASSVTPSDDSRRQRKIKIIRRRPTSVAVSTSEQPVTEPLPSELSSVSPPAPNRIRKIIRKKIIHQLNEPVTERDSNQTEVKSEDDGKLSVILNYGDKARPVVFSAKTETEAIESAPSSESPQSPPPPQSSITESVAKQDITEVINQAAQESSSTPIYNVLTSSEAPVKGENQNDETPAVEITESPELLEATPIASSTAAKSKFERPQYRPSKRLFTPSTEASAVPSSRTYSRKYNGGAYTSPATPDREATARSAVTRRPLFTSKPFLRRPFTTRTTKKVEEEDYSEEEDEEEEVEEPEAQLVLVPDNKLFTRGRHQQNNDDDLEESDKTEDGIPEEEKEEKINKATSRRPLFRPKSINSNTFRTSTSTTEIPKRNFAGTQNRTSIYSKSRPGLNDTKKRTQNVPVGYSALNDSKTANETTTKTSVKQESAIKQADAETTTYNTDTSEESTTDDDYLTATSMDIPTDSVKADDDVTSTNTDSEPATATESMEVDTQTDDYLESTHEAQGPLTTDSPTTISQHVFSETHMIPNVPTTESSQSTYYEIDNELKTTESEEENTAAPEVAPVVETHFDKLFSVSRVVEVSSKLDKHRLNKKNESRLVETGKVMQEKKPTVDRIGEVSRFTLIKIVEDDIPIYLTKLGHVYPVANPPYNPIRIDEGRNARALVNFSDAGRENLVASESVNEAYRHTNKFGSNTKVSADKTDPQVELLKEDNYEVHQNAEDRIDKSNSYSPYPTQWQFVPAAYENDNTKEKHNKAAKSFEVITPRSYKTDPSTIALEGLFKTENPLLIMPRKVSQSDSQRSNNQPFVVYAAPRADDSDPANFVKLQVLKPESGRNIKTFVRGQELSGASAGEDTTVRYPVSITIFPSEINKDDGEVMSTTDIIPSTTETGEATMIEPTTIGLTTPAPTTDTDLKPMTDAAETATEPEVTTKVLSDSLAEYYAKKRSKLTFPRRPNFRNTNITRASFSPLASQATTPRIAKKSSLSPLGSKSNKTSGFNPIKSRFSASRSQNVPVDSRGEKKTKVGAGSLQRQNATEGAPAPTRAPPTAGGDSRRLYFKPIRPNLLRPSFVPRRPSTQPTTQSTTRRNFLRRTKSTDLPPAASESNEATTEAFPAETTTRKFRLRGNSKFDKKRTTAKVTDDTKSKSTPNPADGAASTADGSRNPSEGSRKPAEGFRVKKRPSLLESETASAQTTGAVRRPTRTYVRRRYGSGGANASSTSPLPGSTEKSSAQSEVTRRPFRVATRRRPTSSTPAAPATPGAPGAPAAADEKPTHDLAVQESMERENNNKDHPPETKRPHIKKTVKIQRRPLTSLNKPEQSTAPSTAAPADSSTSEEPKKRESKKYSATFKQNQLDEVIRQKSAEAGKSEEVTESTEELSVDTAIAIAAHQLLGAPLPNTPSYEDDYSTSSKKYSSSSTKAYVGTTEPYIGYSNTKDYSRGATGFSAGAPSLSSTIVSPSGISSSSGISSTSPAYLRSTEVTRDFPRGSSVTGVSNASPAYTRGVSSYVPSPSRYLSTTNKYVSLPIDDFAYSTDSYTSGLGQEPVYFTRDYLMESPVTRRYETDYQYLTTELPTTRQAKRPSSFRRISTTVAPSQNILIVPPATPQPRRVPNKAVNVYDKLPKIEKTYRPILNYDYYDDGDEKLLEKYPETSKVVIHGKGNIECLDQGSFPHPSSCRKFISCARMESGAMVGWEYVCPQGLSYDPVGGICNWSAGLGCHEN